MLLKPGVSRCEACGELVDATDDLLAVQNLKGIQQIPGCRPGFYHYRCFQRAPFAAKYLELDAQQTARQLDRRADQWRSIARDDDFALVHKTLAEQYTLYFLRQGRSVDFFDRQPLIEFLQGLADAGPTAGEAQVTPAGDAVRIQFPETVPISVQLAPADYERLLEDLPKQDEESTEPIDLAELCRQREVTPIQSDCALSRARGRIAALEPLAASGSSYIDLDVEKRKEVRVSTAEFERLRELAAAALAELNNRA